MNTKYYSINLIIKIIKIFCYFLFLELYYISFRLDAAISLLDEKHLSASFEKSPAHNNKAIK